MRKHSLKQNRLDFMDGFISKEEDYTIDGQLTQYAIEELLRLGRTDELSDLLRNARESSIAEN